SNRLGSIAISLAITVRPHLGHDRGDGAVLQEKFGSYMQAGFVGSGGNLEHMQRISPELEDAVIGADSLEVQHLSPDIRQGLLAFRSRSDELFRAHRILPVGCG